MKTNLLIASGPPGATSLRTLLLAIALVAAVALVYWNSLRVPFLFDDLGAVTENPTIRQLGSFEVLSPPTDGSTTTGRPVVNFSFALNYAISGEHVWSYHALNIAIHALAALTLMGIVRRTLTAPALRERFGSAAPSLAFLIALVWALHPLQTESVVCIAQRTESLCALFYLLTLLGFIRAVEPPGPAAGLPAWAWFSLSFLSCLLGMATKEVMSTAPLLVLLYDRTFVAGGFAAAWSRRRGYYLALAGTWVLLACLVLQGGGARGVAAGFGLGVSWWSYLLKQCEALVLYLKLSVWPHPLVLDYGNAVARSVADVWWQGTLVLGLLAGTAWALWRKPVLGFAGAWFFIILAPSSSIVPLVTQTMAEHRMYLPLAGIVSLIIIALHHRLGARAGWILTAVAVVLGCMTVVRNRDYRDGVTIWSDSVASFPASARAHNNLGKELLLAGRVPEAIARLEEALRLKPDYAKAHNNLGVALVERGQIAEAISHYETALRLSSDDGETHHNLGDALLRTGRIAEAEAHYALALQRKPEFAAAQANNLGRVRLEAGRVTEAMTLFTEALRLQPEFAEAHNNLGNALVETGRAGDAMAHYQAALRLRPDDAEARFNLGNALLATGRLEEACESYRAALSLRPGLVEAHNNLGSALFRMGRLTEAAAQYREALRLRPDYAEAKENLERLRAPEH